MVAAATSTAGISTCSRGGVRASELVLVTRPLLLGCREERLCRLLVRPAPSKNV